MIEDFEIVTDNYISMKKEEIIRFLYAFRALKLRCAHGKTVYSCVYLCVCNCCRCMHSIQVLPLHLEQLLSHQQDVCQLVHSLAQALCGFSSIHNHTIMFIQAQGEFLDELCLVLVVINTCLG
jgi:hypothetical protein